MQDLKLPKTKSATSINEKQQQQQNDDVNAKTKNLEKIPLLKYLKSELTRGYLLDDEEQKYTQKRDNVYTFLLLPMYLERFMLYGFFQCADGFFYIFTFLPIRILIALFKIILHPISMFRRDGSKIMKPAQIIDISKGVVILSCCFMLTFIDTSMIYHMIRGQAVIKLYIFFNMLEIADRLLSSVGQDILDALFWTATEPAGKNSKSKSKSGFVYVVLHLALAIVYVFLHAMLVLCQTTTLNVAFNSHNKSLLTIMMSNNFIELKGNVFKKFDRNNLFQMSCSDVRERFHYAVLLFMVGVRNMAEFNWDLDQLSELMPMVVGIFLSEAVIDWIKHGFIVKFNNITLDVYGEYKLCLAYDMIKTKQNNALTDHSDLLSRRMGFIPLPLFCLLVRICSQSMRLPNLISVVNLIVAFLCLMTLKVLIGIVLLGRSCKYINNYKKTTKTSSKSSNSKKSPATATTTTNVNNESKINEFNDNEVFTSANTSSRDNSIQDLTPRKRIISESNNNSSSSKFQ